MVDKVTTVISSYGTWKQRYMMARCLTIITCQCVLKFKIIKGFCGGFQSNQVAIIPELRFTSW